jgi:hypothetical protein
MDGVWQLEIIQPSGNVFIICGSEDVLRTAYDEWREAVKQPDGVAPPVWEVTGFCNSADRAEHSLAIRIEDIWGLALTKLY